VLEHVAQPHPYVEEVLRILKPGGCAYFNVPNYGSLSIRLGFGSFRSNMPPWHACFFTHRTMSGFFSRYHNTLSKVTIRSYGIPEAYGAYLRVQRLLRRRKDRSRPSGLTSPTSDRLGKRAMARLLGATYYHVGRPFKLGDKLEVMVLKAT
jgi:SAM-dependent methyltransferase